jgi:hypothetical protein
MHGWNPAAGTLTLDYVVANDGNVRLSAHQSAVVSAPLTGSASDRLPDVQELLPHNSVKVHTQFSNILPMFHLDARVSVDPMAASGTADPNLPSVVGAQGIWIIASLIAAAALALIVLVLIWLRLRPVRRTTVPAAALVAAAVVAFSLVSLIGGAPSALAAGTPTVGTLTVEPATGIASAAVTVTSSAACPSGTNAIVQVFGHGFPTAGQNVTGNSSLAIYPKTAAGGYSIPLQNTLQHFLDLQPGHPKFSGSYTLKLVCRNAFGPELGAFVGHLSFDSAAKWKAKNAPGAVTAAQATVVPTPSVQAQAQSSAGAAPQAGAGFPGAPSAAPGLPGPSVLTAKSLGMDNRLGGIPVPLLVIGAVGLLGGSLLLNRERREVSVAADAGASGAPRVSAPPIPADPKPADPAAADLQDLDAVVPVTAEPATPEPTSAVPAGVDS